jgi:hypothetical protein
MLRFFLFNGFRMASPLLRSLSSVLNRGRRTTMMQTATLEIVWWNLNPPENRKRWELLKRNSRVAHYLIQEFFSTDAGSLSIWVPTSSLDVLAGGRAA